MKKTAISLMYLFFVLSTPNAFASESHVEVHTDVNTGNSSTTTSTTKTDIDINQTGDGKSEVKVNGKEYKVDGPGQLSVHDGKTTISSPNPTQTPSNSPTASPNPSATESASPTTSSSASPNSSSSPLPGVVKGIVDFLQQILSTIENLFN